MADRLLTARDVQLLMGLATPKAAERLMDAWGVAYVHLGLGRGKGKRWKESRVLSAINSREKEPGAQASRRKPAKPSSIFDLSWKDVSSLTRASGRA